MQSLFRNQSERVVGFGRLQEGGWLEAASEGFKLDRTCV